MSNSLQPHRLYSPRNSPGQNTGVDSCSLLHGIFPTQEQIWGLLHCWRILYQLSYLRSPTHRTSCKMQGWVNHKLESRLLREISTTSDVQMIFVVVMSGCESWTIKKAECQRIDAFETWCWRRLLRVSWTVRRSNQSVLEEISPEYLSERLMLKLKL